MRNSLFLVLLHFAVIAFFLAQTNTLFLNNKWQLEIALASLKNMNATNASFIPWSNHFRFYVLSELWDSVVLHLHGKTSINSIIPFTDFKKQKATI